MKIDKRQILLILFVYVLTMLFTPFVFAASSDADAGRKELNFLTATYNGINLENAVGVPLIPEIVVEFDKDVVNAAVWNNNKNCFKLQSERNEKVKINVTIVNDTADYNQKTKVFIEPAQPLKSGTTYNLKVSPNLRAKNGNSTLSGTTGGAGVTITFKTIGQTVPVPDQETDALSSAAITSNPTDTVSTDTGSAANDSSANNSDANNSATSKSGRFSLTKATTMLTRVVGLLQAVLYLGDSLDQFRVPLEN